MSRNSLNWADDKNPCIFYQGIWGPSWNILDFGAVGEDPSQPSRYRVCRVCDVLPFATRTKKEPAAADAGVASRRSPVSISPVYHHSPRMSSKMADLRHLGEAHESERGQPRQVREDFRFWQAAADGSVAPLELLRFSPDTWSPGCASPLMMRQVVQYWQRPALPRHSLPSHGASSKASS